MVVSPAFVDGFRRPQLSARAVLNLNPLNLLNLVVVPMIAAIVVFSWPISIGLILAYLCLAVAAGRGRAFLSVFWKLAVLIGGFFFLVRALFLPGEEVLAQLGPFAISRRGFDSGVEFACLMVAVSAAIVLVSVVVEPSRLTYALERAGMPHTASFVLLSTLQSISELGAGVRRILDSQRARGIETEGNVLVRVKAFFPTLAPLFLSAIVAAEEKAIAMDARAFSAPTRHTHLRHLRRVPAWEIALVIAVDLLVVAATVWTVASR